MLPADIINAFQSVARTTRQPLSAERNTSPHFAKLLPGQQIEAAIQSKIGDGVFKVQVAGQTMQMRLPGNFQGGDTIKLQVISIHPKITFSLAASTSPLSTPDQLDASSSMLSNLNERPDERLLVQQADGKSVQNTSSEQSNAKSPGTTSTLPSTAEQIGQTAKMLAQLVDSKTVQPSIQQIGNKAIWPEVTSPPDPKQLAAGLHQALGDSGLFYESHQAQWVLGERNLKQLLNEPQNFLANSSNSDTPPLISNAHQPPSNPIAKDMLPMVQQQLYTLENHHMVWMGQVWPGQEMHWEIQGEPEQRNQPSVDRKWSTEMELSLPHLGDVRARLTLSQRGLQLNLHTADAETTKILSQALPQLSESLKRAGLILNIAEFDES